MRLSKTFFEAAVTIFLGLIASLGVCGEEPAGMQTIAADGLLAQGFDAERRGDLDVAERCYRQSLQAAQNVENGRAGIMPLHRLAIINAKRKQFEESEQLFQQALRLDNSNFVLLSDFARLQFDRKQYCDAEIILKHAFLLEPDNTRVLYDLGYAVALQKDRQTEGLRYLKLALGEPQALRELASICRTLGEGEQADFAEQRAAQHEMQLMGRPAEPPSLEARKELYEQIKRELIRAKSLELAKEFEKAGIWSGGADNAQERKTSDPTTVPITDTPLARTEPGASSDPWAVAGQPVALPPTALTANAVTALKPLPETETSQTAFESADRRTRISNGPPAIPLPPIAEQKGSNNRVFRTPPTLADSATPPQYPRYAEIGTPTPRPAPPVPERGAANAQQLANAVESPEPSGRSVFDLVQPVNLVALDARRERQMSVPMAPTPEKIEEVVVRSLPVSAPDLRTVAVNDLPSQNVAARRAPETPHRSTAPTPEIVSSQTPVGNMSPERRRATRADSVVNPKSWKEIGVEPYVYVENARAVRELQTVPKDEPKTLLAASDPWETQRPPSEPVASFRNVDKPRENIEPTSIRAGSDSSLQESLPEQKENLQAAQAVPKSVPVREPPPKKEEIVKLAPAPPPSHMSGRELFERPVPVLAPPVFAAPSPNVTEPEIVETQRAVPSVAALEPRQAAPTKPETLIPSPPRLQQDEPTGIAQTPPARVRIVNIIDDEPPPDDQPGYARSGKYAK